MIIFDESEYCNSPIEEDTLRILLSFLPRSEYDKLLYRQVTYVRCIDRYYPRHMEKRVQLNRIRNCRIRIIEATKSEEKVETLLTLAAG